MCCTFPDRGADEKFDIRLGDAAAPHTVVVSLERGDLVRDSCRQLSGMSLSPFES
jgi:hypothetical protein